MSQNWGQVQSKIAGLPPVLLLLANTVAAQIPSTFDPIVQGSSNAVLKQLAAKFFDPNFERLPPTERQQFNSQFNAAIRSKGSALGRTSPTDPEADYQMALIFLLDIERISKMGSPAERNAVVLAYPDKVKEYLAKYLTRAPSGRYAAKAQELLKAAGGK